MLRVVLKRIGASLVVLLLVSFATFMVVQAIPGDAATLALATDATPQKLAEMRAAMGEDLPLLERYGIWLTGILAGHWGTSSLYGADVQSVLMSALPATLLLAVYAMVLALLIALVFGIAAALHPGSLVDGLARTVIQLASATPVFWLAMLAMLLFAEGFGWFPVSGYVALSEDPLGCLRSLTLPALALAVGECGPLVRMVRSSTMEALEGEYLLGCQVKGLTRAATLLRYVLRGALVAPLTMAGVHLAKLLGGTAVCESIFALPGLGRLLLIAVEQRDIMLVQGIVLFVTIAVVLTTLITDLMVMAANPAVRSHAGDDAL